MLARYRSFGSAFRRLMIVPLFAVPILTVTAVAIADDEPRGFGLSRLFRLGNSRQTSKPAPKPHRQEADDDEDALDIASVPSERSNFRVQDAAPAGPATTFQPAVTSPGFGESSASRITARPKHVGPVTEADPVLTRVGIARADSGNSFALFLQVYADGTVIDTEGVHRLPLAQIKPILSVIRGHDFSRIRGHCGQPSADFIENVQMVVYDRAMGRLRAHAFSYAGDPKGCDPSVAHLHKAVDELIMKLSSNRSGESAEFSTSANSGGAVEIHTGPVVSGRTVIAEEPIRSEIPNQVVTPEPTTITNPAIVTAPNVPSTGGAVVPRLPSASAPSPFAPGGGGLPELAPPR
ncbi:hypothetical protein GC170_09025 [bacterium]|nr:hypothetical protein [bacterium]